MPPRRDAIAAETILPCVATGAVLEKAHVLVRLSATDAPVASVGGCHGRTTPRLRRQFPRLAIPRIRYVEHQGEAVSA